MRDDDTRGARGRLDNVITFADGAERHGAAVFQVDGRADVLLALNPIGERGRRLAILRHELHPLVHLGERALIAVDSHAPPLGGAVVVNVDRSGTVRSSRSNARGEPSGKRGALVSRRVGVFSCRARRIVVRDGARRGVEDHLRISNQVIVKSVSRRAPGDEREDTPSAANAVLNLVTDCEVIGPYRCRRD